LVTIQIIIYAFCEPNDGGGLIAIDDISLSREFPTSSTLSPSTTSSTTEDVTKNTTFSTSSDTILNMTAVEIISTALTTQLPLSTIVTEVEECIFGPCACEQRDISTYNVICQNIYTIQLRDEYFQKLEEYAYEFDWFEITPPFNDSIPFSMFASSISYVNWFTINCDYISNICEVDPFAFTPSLDVANFIFKNCDLANLTFLSQFKNKNDLTFTKSSNLHDVWHTFPVNLKSTVLRFESCNLLELTMDDFPPHSTGLNELRIFDTTEINDDIVNLFFSWALDFSRDSLIKFYIYNNGLKKIPTGLSRFNSLTYFRMDYNILESGIKTIKKQTIFFLKRFYTTQIGIYEMANVYLDGNHLTRFDSDVYQAILEQMANLGDLEDGGFINVEGSTATPFLFHFNMNYFHLVQNTFFLIDGFDCIEDPCHLTWLLRDNRHFLPFVWNAACANGTLFEDIQPDDPMFKDCP